MASIFISYAHLDNEPPFNSEFGWVTYCVENLKSNIGRKLGRKSHFDLWMDYKLKGNDDLTPAIEAQLKTTDTLVIFLSPAWLASKWCQQELKIFLRQDRNHAGSIFIVELDKSNQPKPVALGDMLGYRFWEQTHQEKTQILGFPLPNIERDQAYFKRILDLSDDLSRTLSHLSQESQPSQQPEATVYIAPVHDALVDSRNELINELRQYNIAVLPQSNTIKLDNFKQTTQDELKQCSHFIQLLDNDYNSGIPSHQKELAVNSEIPVLQWVNPELDCNKVNKKHKPFLQGAEVQAVLLTDFKRIVREQVLKQEQDNDQPIKTNGSKIIFVHTGQEDMDYAQQIVTQLKNKGYGTVLPRYTGEAEQIVASIKRGIKYCHIMLLLQKATSVDVIEDFLADIVTQSDQRKRELPLLICSDHKAEEILFTPANIRILQCKNKFDEHCLEQFLAEVDA